MLLPCFSFKWQTVAFFFWLSDRISFVPETNRYFKHFNVCAKRKMLAPLSTTGAGAVAWAVACARPRSKVTIVARPMAGLECPCPCSCPCTFPPRCQVATGWHWVVCAPNGDPSRPSSHPYSSFTSSLSGIAFKPPLVKHAGNMCTSYFSAISQLE